MRAKSGRTVRVEKEAKRASHPANVYVLVIEHRHGDNLYVCRTKQGAQRELDQYVREWWDHEMPDRRMPRRRSERIDEYFREMGESRQKESYTISEAELL